MATLELIGGLLMVAPLVVFAFWLFEGRESAAHTAAQQYPLAAGVIREVPAPRLQPQPFKDVYVLRGEEAARLSSYGWVDKQGGVTRIPIDRAMELMLQRGFPVRSEQGDALNVVTQDSSSGRTIVPR